MDNFNIFKVNNITHELANSLEKLISLIKFTSGETDNDINKREQNISKEDCLKVFNEVNQSLSKYKIIKKLQEEN